MEQSAPRPVVALMGEFSAGKSTLSNLLLGVDRSPVKVTATQLPPVWFSLGEERMLVVGRDGTETELAPGALDRVQVSETSHVRVWLTADALHLMDLIDMPGNSDPNMPPEVWQSMMPHVDAAVWCSHATQAWRQSEAATWGEMPDDLQRQSLLLLTRFDKLLSEIDRAKVLRRVRAETEGLFRGVYPVALTQALAAGEDRGLWEASGAEAFSQALLDLVSDLADRPRAGASRVARLPDRSGEPRQDPPGVEPARPSALVLRHPAAAVEPAAPGEMSAAHLPRRVLPMRPARDGLREPERPRRPSA